MVVRIIEQSTTVFNRSNLDEMRRQQWVVFVVELIKIKMDLIHEKGRLPDDWLESVQGFEEVLCKEGDIMVCLDSSNRKKYDRSVELLHELAAVIAVLAFAKKEISIFGYRFEAEFEGGCGKA